MLSTVTFQICCINAPRLSFALLGNTYRNQYGEVRHNEHVVHLFFLLSCCRLRWAGADPIGGEAGQSGPVTCQSQGWYREKVHTHIHTRRQLTRLHVFGLCDETGEPGGHKEDTRRTQGGRTHSIQNPRTVQMFTSLRYRLELLKNRIIVFFIYF